MDEIEEMCELLEINKRGKLLEELLWMVENDDDDDLS